MRIHNARFVTFRYSHHAIYAYFSVDSCLVTSKCNMLGSIVNAMHTQVTTTTTTTNCADNSDQ